jgi:hypothetical protein
MTRTGVRAISLIKKRKEESGQRKTEAASRAAVLYEQ